MVLAAKSIEIKVAIAGKTEDATQIIAFYINWKFRGCTLKNSIIIPYNTLQIPIITMEKPGFQNPGLFTVYKNDFRDFQNIRYASVAHSLPIKYASIGHYRRTEACKRINIRTWTATHCLVNICTEASCAPR